jgi:hypothetical protein
MSWLLPSALAIVGVAALATIALHFISRSRPIAEPLPTARFVPPRPIRARTRSFAFSDVPLLLLRLAALASVGAAIAGPVFAGAHGRVGRVIVADGSRSVASANEVKDSVRALQRPGDELVTFDTISFSAGLARAFRSAATLAGVVDSIELIVISPLAASEIDAATDSIRRAWPGRSRVVRVAAASTHDAPARLQLPNEPNDALVAGLSLMGLSSPNGWIRLVHGAPTLADSTWASDSGHVLLVWPHQGRDVAWQQRASVDAIGGVSSATGTLVARFPRVWSVSGRAIARWSDGEPAAVERVHGRGCIRDVAILIDPASDVTLRQSFREFVAGLLEPCGGAANNAPLPATRIASLVGTGSLAPAGALAPRHGRTAKLTPWLLVLAAALLTVELAMRRTERRKS